MTFTHKLHTRTAEVAAGIPRPAPKVNDERSGFSGWLGLHITQIVGTMACAGLFTVIALVSLPAAIATGDKIVIVAWIAQTFLQLVLLPVIIVGQNIQAKAADKRAQGTFEDAEAVLHECLQIQAHLHEQDVFLNPVAKVDDVVPAVKRAPAKKAPAKRATKKAS